MTLYRCDKRENGKQCVLAIEHVGVVPCRFAAIQFAVCPRYGIKTAQARKSMAAVARAAYTSALTQYAKRELRKPELPQLHFSIPLVPPSVNHYKIPRRGGRGFVLTKEARSFQQAVAVLTKGSVRAFQYEISVQVWLGYNQRGDADNFNKVVLDSLQKADIITTDAAVKSCHTYVYRDWDNPRTEVTIKQWLG